jgi:hypothetical protein
MLSNTSNQAFVSDIKSVIVYPISEGDIMDFMIVGAVVMFVALLVLIMTQLQKGNRASAGSHYSRRSGVATSGGFEGDSSYTSSSYIGITTNSAFVGDSSSDSSCDTSNETSSYDSSSASCDSGGDSGGGSSD